MPILPGVMPIIGETDAEAKEQLDKLQSWLTPTNALALVSNRIGFDISGYPLDGPVPEFSAATNRGQSFSVALLDMARREKMTLRDLYNITAAARGHWVVYGTPRRIADTLEDWFVSGLGRRLHHHAGLFPRPRSTISSISSCPNCSGAACIGKTIPGRRCVTILVLKRRPPRPTATRERIATAS